jgi:hypothetical protein
MTDDRTQIEELVYEYAFRLDAGDVDGFAELFAHGEWTLAGDGASRCTVHRPCSGG